MGWLRWGEPLLCRLGFHKWQNYGNQVVVSCKEPVVTGGAMTFPYAKQPPRTDGLPVRKEAQEVHSKVMYEGQQCKRCGIKLMRKFVKNSDGTLSCVGWEPYTEETDKE